MDNRNIFTKHEISDILQSFYILYEYNVRSAIGSHHNLNVATPFQLPLLSVAHLLTTDYRAVRIGISKGQAFEERSEIDKE